MCFDIYFPFQIGFSQSTYAPATKGHGCHSIQCYDMFTYSIRNISGLLHALVPFCVSGGQYLSWLERWLLFPMSAVRIPPLSVARD